MLLQISGGIPIEVTAVLLSGMGIILQTQTGRRIGFQLFKNFNTAMLAKKILETNSISKLSSITFVERENIDPCMLRNHIHHHLDVGVFSYQMN